MMFNGSKKWSHSRSIAIGVCSAALFDRCEEVQSFKDVFEFALGVVSLGNIAVPAFESDVKSRQAQGC